MKGHLAAAALVGAAFASPIAQSNGASSGTACANSYPGTFTINDVLVSSKRSVEERQAQVLTLTLMNGVLMDQAGRIGYIAANRQFQFDNPIQAGAVITSGWQVCQNGHLTLSGKDTFYECLSGNFYNLYDTTQGGQCQAIYIEVLPMSGGATTAAPAPAASSAKPTQISDGQVQASSAKVSQITDGQVQASSAAKVTQITDGQVQAPSAKVTQISDGQVQAPTGRVTQISDGQIQAPTGKVTQISDGQVQAPKPTGSVTQISDGQVQAPKTSAAATGKVTQISDGQVQASSAATGKVTQISDGQIQASKASSMVSSAKVTQISDGQVQAPTSTAAKVTQISDGQVQATSARPAVATFTGAAGRDVAGSFAFVAGIVGAVALL